MTEEDSRLLRKSLDDRGAVSNIYKTEFRSSSVLPPVSTFRTSSYFRKAGRFRNLNNFSSFVRYEPDRIQSRDEKVKNYLRLMETEDEAVILATDNRQLIKNILSRQALADSNTKDRTSRHSRSRARARHGGQGSFELFSPKQASRGLPSIAHNSPGRSLNMSFQQANARSNRPEAGLMKST